MKDIAAPYEELKRRYMTGWKTWNVNSILSYVYMPYGLTLSLCLKEYKNGGYLREVLIGRQGPDAERVFPGAHSGDYTQARVQWRGLDFTVETASKEERLVILIQPLACQPYPAMIVLETGFLWNLSGQVQGDTRVLTACCGGKNLAIRSVGTLPKEDPNLPAMNKWLPLAFKEPVIFYTGDEMSPDELFAFVKDKREAYCARWETEDKTVGSLYEAIMCGVNWNTIYDAKNKRIISPVSRIWSVGAGGYVLFCWDSYFVSLLASLFDHDLAYANLIEITAEKTLAGFIPNLTYGTGQQSLDRSQTPVGSAMALAVYRITNDLWPLNHLYSDLLEWNTWFYNHRMHPSGALGWGSNPFESVYGNKWEVDGVNNRFGAALESGLDNSPMYDNIPFDKEKHMLCLEDVGLTGLFILDCRALEQISDLIGDKKNAQVLRKRREKVEKGLEELWNEEQGFYFNRRTDTGEFSQVLSPTNFYALFSRQIPRERLKRIEAYYFDPEVFYGDWMIPSVMRCHPAFQEQDYWRGRIWAPLNFLVYLALQGHNMLSMQHDLASKSKSLFLKEWLEYRHIHENYSAITGEGCDKKNSDRFYHWGALLAIIWLMECGEVPPIMN
ncbi:MAG: hypothetical protein GX587_09545 [Bacteroidales bacterium]|nr:hypothetical protein [Bacteroidales bacterium]